MIKRVCDENKEGWRGKTREKEKKKEKGSRMKRF